MVCWNLGTLMVVKMSITIAASKYFFRILASLVIFALVFVALNFFGLEIYKTSSSSKYKTPFEIHHISLNDRLISLDLEQKLALYPLSKEQNFKGLHLYLQFDQKNYKLWFKGKQVVTNSILDFPVARYNAPISMEIEIKGKKYPFKFQFTNLPLVTLWAPKIYDLFKAPSKFQLTSAKNGESVAIRNAGIEIRGLTSRGLPKKGYSLQLGSKKNWKKGKDISLLGMRKDDDWILSGEHRDRSLSRNLVAHRIYNQIHADYGVKGKLVEVFLNNQYLGPHNLMQRIDRKSMGLPKDSTGVKGLAYKLNRYFTEQQDFFQFMIGKKTTWHSYFRLMRAISQAGADGVLIVHHTFSFAKPAQNIIYNCSRFMMPLKSGKNYAVDGTRWQSRCRQKLPKFAPLSNLRPLKDIHRATYYSDDKTFMDFVNQRFDMKNLVDYWIMLQVTGAADNHSKNYYLWSSPNRVIRFLPWDIDASFGFGYSGQKGIDKVQPYRLENNGFFHRLITLPNLRFNELLHQRWSELREGGFSAKSIADLFESNRVRLAAGDALKRNYDLWYPGEDKNDHGNFKFIKDWLRNRFVFLDKKWKSKK